MEEETIVINDLLSFIWCKTKTTPKNVLLKCVEAFYSEQFASDALHSLITAGPFNLKRELSSNPFEAIIELMEYTPINQLPTFVCRNLNNVPDIDSFSSQMVDNGLENDIYVEHRRLVCELEVLNKSLANLSDRLNTVAEHDRLNVMNNVETIERSYNSVAPLSREHSAKGEIKNIKVETEDETLDTIEDETFHAYEELRMGLIANRYQRALARRAEKGNEERKAKKFKPIVFDSVQKSPVEKVENVLSPSDTIFPSSCKMNTMGSSVSKNNKNSIPFGSHKYAKSPADGDEGIMGNTQGRYLSDVPTPDYKVLNVLCSENSQVSKNPGISVPKPNNKETRLRIQYLCPLCANGFFEEDWANHVRGCRGEGTKNPDDLRCHICNCFFADKKMLGFHMGYHDSARQFGCNECGYRFYTEKALEGHLKLHSPLCKNKCPFCNFKTFKAGRVKEHVRSHTGERPYKCKLCSYATTTYDILRGHTKSHSVIKEFFKCDKCNKTYSSKSKLRAHEQSFHSDEGKQGYHTPACTTPHSTPSVIETLYPCSDCPFKHKDRNVLREHMQKHTAKYSAPYAGDLVIAEPQFKPRSQKKGKGSLARSPR